MSLKGKVALVTGSTSGIGHAVAKRLAEQGANIMINGIADDAVVKAALAEIEALGVKAAFCGADLSTAEGAEELVREAEKALGPVDVLVNNAGIQHTDLIEDFPPEKWDFILSLMLTSPYHLIRHTIKGMKSRGWGRIVNIASAHGKVASAKKSAYVSAKHGLVGLTKVVGLEAAGTGVTCNAVCPGWVLTPLVQKQIDALAQNENLSQEDAKKKLLMEKQPSGQFVLPEQIGGMVSYLCSDDAAQITGTALSIDGGWTAQ